MSVIKEIFVIVGIPIARSILGWLKISLEDNIISYFEWKKMVVTIIQVGTATICTYYGLQLAGVDIPVLAASFAGVMFDKVISALKETKQIKPVFKPYATNKKLFRFFKKKD